MLRCAYVLVIASLIGCGSSDGSDVQPSDASQESVDAPLADSTIDPSDSTSGEVRPDSGAPVDVAAPVSDGSAGVVADGGVEAGRDASADASVDARQGASDASDANVRDSSVDAVADADANPLACSGSPFQRCVGYAEEQCINGEWMRSFGQSCCHTTGRFTVSEYVASDSTTGLDWSRNVLRYQCGFPHADCVLHMAAYDAGAGWRTPTASEMGTLTIGPLDDAGRTVCSPTMDQNVFVGEEPGLYHGSDYYYDFARGRVGPDTTTNANCYAICVR